MTQTTRDNIVCLAVSVFMGVGPRREFVQSILSFLPNGNWQLHDRVQVRLSSATSVPGSTLALLVAKRAVSESRVSQLARLQQISLDKERRICMAAWALASVPWLKRAMAEARVQALACCSGAHMATLFGADSRGRATRPQ